MSFVYDLFKKRGGDEIPVDVVGNYTLRVGYSRIDGVWHVVTMGLTPRLGHELALRVPGFAEVPQWEGETLLKLGRTLEPGATDAELLSKSVPLPRVSPNQALVPVLRVDVDGGVIVECLGLFPPEADRLRDAPAAAAAFGADLQWITQDRVLWDPDEGVSLKLMTFRAAFTREAEWNIFRLLGKRSSNAVVDVVLSDQFADMVVGLTTVVDTVDGPAWQILGVVGEVANVGLRGRFEPGQKAPPPWLTQSWLWWLRALDFAGYLPGPHEPVQKAEWLFTRGDDRRRCWMLLPDPIFSRAGSDDDTVHVVVPLHDDEFDAFSAGRIDSAGLTAAVTAARPSLRAEPDRPSVVAAVSTPATPTKRQFRFRHLELDEDDHGPFLIVDKESAGTIGAAWAGLVAGAHENVELLGDGALRVRVALGDVTRHAIDGPTVNLTATRADLQAAADALAATAEAQVSLRILVF